MKIILGEETQNRVLSILDKTCKIQKLYDTYDKTYFNTQRIKENEDSFILINNSNYNDILEDFVYECWFHNYDMSDWLYQYFIYNHWSNKDTTVINRVLASAIDRSTLEFRLVDLEKRHNLLMDLACKGNLWSQSLLIYKFGLHPQRFYRDKGALHSDINYYNILLFKDQGWDLKQRLEDYFEYETEYNNKVNKAHQDYSEKLLKLIKPNSLDCDPQKLKELCDHIYIRLEPRFKNDIIDRLAILLQEAYNASEEAKADIKNLHEFYIGIFRSFSRIKTGGVCGNNMLKYLISCLDNNLLLRDFIKETMVSKSYVDE